MKTHSTLGPSSAERWFACPGSIRLIEALPDNAFFTSEAAAEGSVAHTIAEEYLKGKLTDLELMNLPGETRMQDGYEIEITEEMVNAVAEYHDLILEDKKALERNGKPAAVISKTELRVHAKALDEDLWGTADHVLYQKGHKLTVYDFKYGKGKIVEVEKNPQACIYAVAAMETEAGWAFDEIEVVIVQPRGRHADGTVRRWSAPVTWFKNFAAKLGEYARAVRIPDAPLVAGDHCRWCPAKPTCPAIYKAVQAQAQVDFEKVPAATTALPLITMMPIEKLATALDWEEAIDSWFKSIKERVQAMLSADPNSVPGWKLVDGRTIRRWGNEEEVVAKFEPILGEKIFAPRKLLSPAQMEKVVGKEEVAPLTIKPEGKKNIAKSSDPRPVAKSTAQEDFTAINGNGEETPQLDLFEGLEPTAPAKIWA